MNQDQEIRQLIEKELDRQNNELELIASENYVSKEVMETLASVLTNKYSEGYPGKRYYGGNQIIDEVENLAIDRAKKLFQAPHVNVQPLSGSPANAAVYMAFLEPGDKILGLKLDHGGHLSHGHKVNFSGRLYNFVQYGLNQAAYIDMDEVKRIAIKEKPKMIVVGFSAYSREVDWLGFQEIADLVGAYSFADIAHIAGLIAGKCLYNPVPIFDVVSTTTHKTLRGPRGAMIMSQEKYAKQIDRAVFPGMQGGPHENVIAAKAVAFHEAMQEEFKVYCQQVILNAQTLASELIKKDFNVLSGGTDNHMLVVNLLNKKMSGKEAEKILEEIGISVSRSTIPNDPNPPFNPSGLRLGTPAISTRGMKEKEMLILANIIDRALDKKEDKLILKEEVMTLCQKFPLPY
jgi:glycine hydroxymethyltransferase